MDVLKKKLIEESEFSDMNYYFMQLALKYRNKYLMNKHGDLFLTVDSLIHLNNIITRSSNIELRKVNVQVDYSKMYMDKRNIDHAFDALVNNFNNRLITKNDFCEAFLDRIHLFRLGNGRTCKILFVPN